MGLFSLESHHIRPLIVPPPPELYSHQATSYSKLSDYFNKKLVATPFGKRLIAHFIFEIDTHETFRGVRFNKKP